MGEQPGGNTCTRKVVNCDRECWVKERLATTIRMAIDLHKNSFVGADEPLFRYAIEGLINGAAVEIIHTLGMEPEYVNIRRLS